MAAEVKKEIRLQIGYVLFIDIVGYSKLLNEELSFPRSTDSLDSRRRTERETILRLIRDPFGGKRSYGKLADLSSRRDLV